MGDQNTSGGKTHARTHIHAPQCETGIMMDFFKKNVIPVVENVTNDCGRLQPMKNT